MNGKSEKLYGIIINSIINIIIENRKIDINVLSVITDT